MTNAHAALDAIIDEARTSDTIDTDASIVTALATLDADALPVEFASCVREAVAAERRTDDARETNYAIVTALVAAADALDAPAAADPFTAPAAAEYPTPTAADAAVVAADPFTADEAPAAPLSVEAVGAGAMACCTSAIGPVCGHRRSPALDVCRQCGERVSDTDPRGYEAPSGQRGHTAHDEAPARPLPVNGDRARLVRRAARHGLDVRPADVRYLDGVATIDGVPGDDWIDAMTLD